jgi:hypothetical protein
MAHLGDVTEPVPVTDLTVEGYKVNNGLSWRRNGRSYLVELRPGESTAEAKARGDKAAALLESVLQQVPADKAALQRGLALLEGANPADSLWAKKFDIPGFHSEASGGFGGTHIWGGQDPKPTTLAHEFGHTVDSHLHGHETWLSNADGPVIPDQELSWKAAASSDSGTSGFYQDRFKETRLHPFVKPITLGSKGVTGYGLVDPREDFAESVRLWLKDRREGKVGYDPSTGDNIHFSDLFPERARILDAAFGTLTGFDTPARLKRRKEAEAAFVKNQQEWDANPNVKGLDDAQQAIAHGLPLDEIKAARVRAGIAHAKAKADAKIKAKADAEAKKVAEEKAAALAKAKAEVETVTAALAAGKLEAADAKKFRAAVTKYKNTLRDQGLSEAEVEQMGAAYETSLIHKHLGLDAIPAAEISPKWVTADNKAADDWVRSAGGVLHPLAEKQWGSAPQAKANIAAELADRLNNADDWTKLRNWHVNSGATDPGEFDSMSPEQRHERLASEVSTRVSKWAGTSGDSDQQAVLMQEAVKQEFGTSGHSAPAYSAETFQAVMTNTWEHAGPWFQRVARVMHDHTQDEFKKAGITHVAAYRGMSFSWGGTPDWAQDGEHRVELQPANSWSTRRSTSVKFTKGKTHRIMIKARIPVELILGSARTGFGCLEEEELVILDANGKAQVKVL